MTPFNILAWKIPWTEEPTRLHGVAKSWAQLRPTTWNSNILATWCKELTHLKRPWCWQRLKAGGEGNDRGWDGWMASPTQWTWVWINSGSWWWTGRTGVLWFMMSQRVGHDRATELNWTCSVCRHGNSGWHRSLEGCNLWVAKSWTQLSNWTTEPLLTAVETENFMFPSSYL